MRLRLSGILFVIMLLFSALALAQDGGAIEPVDMDMANPNANISFPPPVYVVRDAVDIRGTVNLPGLLNYLIEFRPLQLGIMDGDMEEAPWFPATVPQLSPVEDDVLGAWNTLNARDGIYELRMTVNTADGPQTVRLSPIRVENEVSPFAMPVEPVVVEPDMPEEPAEPDPTPTQTIEGARVTALVNSNVRSGDSTLHPVVSFLLEGDSAEILAVSSRGTGWFWIQLANGVSGFIHPNIVETQGDLSNLPQRTPPPVPPTAVPIPTAVPQQPAQPTTGPNIHIDGVPWMSKHPVVCGETVTVRVTVRNSGNAPADNVLVLVKNTHRNTGTVSAETRIAIPGPIAPGQVSTGEGKLTVWIYFNETHDLNFYADPDGLVNETNEGDNHTAGVAYPLQKGNCS